MFSGFEFVGDAQISFQWWTPLRGEGKWGRCAFVCTVCLLNFFDIIKLLSPRHVNGLTQLRE